MTVTALVLAVCGMVMLLYFTILLLLPVWLLGYYLLMFAEVNRRTAGSRIGRRKYPLCFDPSGDGI